MNARSNIRIHITYTSSAMRWVTFASRARNTSGTDGRRQEGRCTTEPRGIFKFKYDIPLLCVFNIRMEWQAAVITNICVYVCACYFDLWLASALLFLLPAYFKNEMERALTRHATASFISKLYLCILWFNVVGPLRVSDIR